MASSVWFGDRDGPGDRAVPVGGRRDRAFPESLGGSGYDAANAGPRIVALTTLHNLVAPLGAITLAAVPVGVVTALAMLVAWAVRRNRPTPA